MTLKQRKIPFCVIELNPDTVERCSIGGTPIIKGDSTNPEVLKEAGIEKALGLIIAIPDDAAVLATLIAARRLNAQLKIVARLSFTSAGLEAKSHGADEVIVAEQLLAAEMAKKVGDIQF